MKHERKVGELKCAMARTNWPDGPSGKPGPYSVSKVRNRRKARKAIKRATRRVMKRIGIRDIRAEVG